MNFRTLLHLSKRTAASAVVALAFLMASQTVHAQEDDRKQEVVVEAESVAEQPRKTLGKDRSTGPTELLVLEKKAESRKKLDAQIVRLKELLKITRKGDARRAEVLFNLSEAYWEKSKSYGQEVFVKQDECYALRDGGDEKAAKRCEITMGDMKAESNRLREESIGLYIEIVNNYPDFNQLDSVLYYLGANLQEIGKKEQSLEMFKRLAADFPDSKYIPNALLAFGDHYFDEGEMENALRAYKRVQAYPNSPVFAYARYKEGWCYFNLDEKEKALETFLQVLDLAKKDKSSTAAGLIKQTRKDIVMTYSFIGSPAKAIPFFKKITSGDEWLSLTERLAVLYSDKGRPEESTELYRALIRADKTSWKVVEYQYEIVRNVMIGRQPYNKDVVGELIALLKLVQYADEGKFKQMDQEEYKKVRAKIEEFVRNNCSLYHREAQKTKSNDLYGLSYVLYKNYIETFPTGPKTYQMTFFYAELLYRVQKYLEAAKMYERAIELEPEGKFTNEAVHGLVLSYLKEVKVEDDKKDLNASANAMMEAAMEANESKSPGKKKESPVPQPKEIPDLDQRLIKACELYAKLNPKGKEIVEVKYTMARRYYDYNHFDKAIPLFKDIAYSHSKDPLAIVAANLQLDSLNLQHDYDGLEQETTEYLEKRPIKDEEFITQLQTLGSSIKFMKCTVFDEKEQWKDAAYCFVSFFRNFPESEHIDKALYNAALDFERMKDLGKAVQTRIQLLKATPDSPLAPKSLFNIGANYHALAIYSSASDFYERYADAYPKTPEAKEALANASTFRQGLGEYDKAIGDYEKYLKRYGKEDQRKAADIYFQIAKIKELQKDEEGANAQYKRYIKTYGKKGSPDQLLAANLKLGLYLWNQEGWKSRLKAIKQFKHTIKIYDRMNKKTKEGLTEGLDAVAQAQFMIGEDFYNEMARMKLNSKNEKELKKQLEDKYKVAQKAHGEFEKVIGYKRPDWAIAALYRVGNAYENFANSIRKSPPPRRLTYDQKEIYRGILEDYASAREVNAVEAYEKALEVAKNASWFNDFSEKAEQHLSQLRPQDYRTPSEKRARPDNFFVGLSRSKYIKQIEDEDRLQDMQGSADASAEQLAPQQTEEASDGQ